jgi:hypothetical protein
VNENLYDIFALDGNICTEGESVNFYSIEIILPCFVQGRQLFYKTIDIHIDLYEQVGIYYSLPSTIFFGKLF